ncbi:MAG TPA: glycerophosphodiester phosphodiesterase [Microscillaceae bacterium]|nr:glycerophosphodiester phosphodiesterase [Microscillaceae bacterium]
MNKYLAKLFYGIALVLIYGCGQSTSNNNSQDTIATAQKISRVFDLQGHRGARGLRPENTISAFIEGINQGIRTVELDVVISKDSQVVVSHEPFFNHNICLDSTGKPIAEADEKKWNLFEMTAAQIGKFDCGSIGNPRFPEQKKRKDKKPTLAEAVQAVEAYAKNRRIRSLFYNIETKSRPAWDNKYHPTPEVFVEILFKTLGQLNILHRTFIQSFDVRTLQAFRKLNPQTKLVLLVENKMSFEENLQKLGFEPTVYSPYYKLVTPELIAKAHAKKIQVIPWTVNDVQEAEKLKKMGIDGIITDYPGKIK